MASKAFLTSSSILKQMSKIFCSSPQAAGYGLQQHLSPAYSPSRTLSSFYPAAFLGSTSSDARRETPKPMCSLYTCGNHGQETVLATGFKSSILQIRSYKSIIRPKLICDGCYFVWRHGRKFVECSDHPRHKQMKKVITRKVWQEDYSKGDIAKAHDWHTRFPREFKRTADRTALSHNWLAGKLGTEV